MGGVSSPVRDQRREPARSTGNVADLLRRAAQQHPDRPAVIAASGSRTWAQLDAAADAGVVALRSFGFDRGERVVIALPTGADLAAALFACARAGLIAVPIGPSHGDTGEVADRVGAMAAISVDHDHGLPVGLDQHDVAGWWAAGPVASPPAAADGGENLAVLARARADRSVMLSHRSILAAVEAIGLLDDRRVRDADRVLQVLPMYHVAGWVVAFLPTTLVGGATVIPEVGFDTATISIGAPDGALRGSPDIVAAGRRAAESAVAAAAEHQVTVVPGAPGFFHHLVGMDGAEVSLGTVRLLTSGTAPLDTDDFGAVQTLIGHPVWEGYGLSEAASVVASTLMTEAPRHGSVGKPLAGIELRIVGPDGQDVNADDDSERVEAVTAESAESNDPLDVMVDAPDAGEVGRIAIRGATLFSGYWPDGHGGPAADGWFVTGDIGFLDDDGELHLVDRASETVTVAGFTVYPREVEQVLGLHPGVAEAAVIGVPAAGGGEEVAAVLVPRADAVLTVADLADFVQSRLPAFKRPAVYQLAPSLPRTEVGRLDRGVVLRNFTRTPNATLPRLVAVAPSADGTVTVDGGEAAEVDGESETGPSQHEAVDVTPEQVADLDELGVRLPASGSREERGDQDTDEDLF